MFYHVFVIRLLMPNSATPSFPIIVAALEEKQVAATHRPMIKEKNRLQS
jgi:hypothetical protein